MNAPPAGGRRGGHPRAGWVLAFAVVASLLVVPVVSDAAPPVPLRIMPLGDSNTDGFAVPGGYRIDLEDDLAAAGYTIDFVGSLSNGPPSLADRNHEGHVGITIDGLRGGFATWFATSPADVILLLGGTNDLKIGTSTDGDPVAASGRLRQLLVDITTRAPGAEVLVSTLPPQTSVEAQARVAQFNAIVPTVVEDLASEGRSVTLVDGAAVLTTADLVDSLHLSAGGFSKLADAWLAGISEVSATPSTTTSTSTSVPVVPVGVAVDGFDRVDSVGLGSADVGGVWQAFGAGFRVVGGSAGAVVGGVGEGVALLDVGVDVSVESVMTLSSGNASPGLSVRAVDARNQLLVSLVRRSGENRVSLFKVDQGTYQELGRAALGLVAGGSYVLRVEAKGSAVRVFVDGVLVLERVLSSADAVTFGARSKAGLRTYGGAEDGGSRWDNFAVTTLGGSTTTTTTVPATTTTAPTTTTLPPATTTTTTTVPSTTTTTSTSVPVVPVGVAVDGFDRVDSVGLGSADVGGVWQAFGAGFRVVGGSAGAVVGGVGEGVALLDVGVDVSVESVMTLSSGNASPGLSVRAVDARNQLLVSLVRRSGENRVSLFKVDQGTYQELGRAALGLVAGGSYVLRVEAKGSAVRVFVDGVLVLERVLSSADAVTFGARSKAGLRTYGGAEDGGSRWDNFAVTTLGGSTTTTTTTDHDDDGAAGDDGDHDDDVDVGAGGAGGGGGGWV
jgi:lysophospholipase L1-like esterase